MSLIKCGKCNIAKLAIGIISMFLFVIILIQSFLFALENSTLEIILIACAFFILIAGIISFTARNSNNKVDSIAATIFYWFATLFSTGNSSTYKYSLFWGSIAFCFGLINLGEFLPIHVKNTKNRYLLIIFIAVVSIAFFIYSFNWDIIFGYEHLGRLLWYIIFD